VVPSIWNDPLPRVVFEAFSAGVPVVGSRIGGIPEMINEGQNGFLFEPHDSRELAGILSRIVSAPRVVRGMETSCRTRAEHFTADRFADDYVRLYHELVRRQKRR
jgi:glycosyltransferase involved in cell wall biosynthesis